MSIEAMKQALGALELALCSHGVMLLSDPPQDAWKYHGVEADANKAITALRTAIAEVEKQDSDGIGWLRKDGGYFNPPTVHRPWVGLTGEETTAIELGLRIPTGYRDAYDLSLRDFAKAIEAKLKEKNT